MSKRGGGRGHGNMTFNMEAIGFGRGDQLPAPTLQPPPEYPPLRQQPVSLMSNEEVTYIVSLKKDYLRTMQNSPYYIRAEQEKRMVERYSDKYKDILNVDNVIDWTPDWRRLPKELKIAVRKKKSKLKVVASNAKTNKTTLRGGDVDFEKQLSALEEKDGKTEEKASEKDEESENDEVDNVLENEDEEEENDYLTSYFDNGESYLDEEDDTLDDAEGGIY